MHPKEHLFWTAWLEDEEDETGKYGACHSTSPHILLDFKEIPADWSHFLT